MDDITKRELTKLQKRVASTELALHKIVAICEKQQSHVEMLSKLVHKMAETNVEILQKLNSKVN